MNTMDCDLAKTWTLNWQTNQKQMNNQLRLSKDKKQIWNIKLTTTKPMNK
jgi:hypothetical protein